jgi:hypothetical protein
LEELTVRKPLSAARKIFCECESAYPPVAFDRPRRKIHLLLRKARTILRRQRLC